MLLQTFPNGLLRLPRSEPAVVMELLDWAHQPHIEALIILEAFLILFFLKDRILLFRELIPCLQRWRALVSLEHNLQQARNRDRLALVMSPAIVLCLQGCGIIRHSLLWIALLLITWYLLRVLLYALVPHRLVNSEYWSACRNSMNFLLSEMAYLWLLSIAVCVLFSLPLPVRAYLLSFEAAACFLILFVRQFQILSSQCGSFRAFLYLCGLEIIPVAGLVLTIVFV
ncbi:MAG: hypothetical protein ACI3ZF_03905 [Candidatus Cryptobacteroides sp.]